MVDQDKELNFDPELDYLFYSAGLDDCSFKESEYQSICSRIDVQYMWTTHSLNECNIIFIVKQVEYDVTERQSSSR